ncbi:MAG: hypothetical protein KAG61_10320 [Bacteriovoracaceae bacterium]|nr:hypothetical protein [Bacteriovoracaceae bacterium]
MKKSVFLITLFFLISAQGQELNKKAQEWNFKGFYYDKERGKYFSNSKSVFTIRPTSTKEYLDKIEVSVDGSEFKTYGGALKFTNEGPHQVRFRAVDPVLNWSPVQTFRIFVDQTAPKSQIVWKGPTYEDGKTTFINPKTVLNVIGQDNLSGVATILWKKGNKETAFPRRATFAKEGNYSYQIRAIDNVGNSEGSYGLSFTVDRNAPKTTAQIVGTKSNSDKKFYTTTGSQIELKSTDLKSGIQRVEYQINDGLISTYKRPIVLSETKTTLKYRAIDKVENREKWKSMDVYQDVRPPKISLEKKGRFYTISGKIYARPGFSFRAFVNDADSGTAKKLVSFDGVTYSETKEKTFTFKKSGETKFHLKAIDKVGNTEETNPYSIVIDSTPPTIKMKSSELLVKKNNYLLSSVPNRITFSTTDTGVGVDRIEISYDGKKFKTLNSPIELSKWKERRRNLYYRAIDRLGNIGEAKKVEIYVKTRGPKVELYVESENLPNVPLSKIKK